MYGNVGAEAPCSSYTTFTGELVLDEEGETVEHKNIIGKVYIGNEHVTLRNDCVTTDGKGELTGETMIRVSAEGGGANITHVTAKGKNSSTESVQIGLASDGLAVVGGAPQAKASYVLAENCGECVHGSWELTNSYLKSGAEIEGEHYETVYCNNTTFIGRHNVMINPHNQTATVFCDTNGGAGGVAQNHIILEGNLLAGGGYTMYPQSASTEVGTSTMRIVNNNIARCLSEKLFEPIQGGHFCINGPDEYGYFPEGGFYGWLAYAYCPPIAGQVWERNVWDNNREPVEC